jgi:hypothetical protein
LEELLTIEFERTGGFTGIPVRVILNGGLLPPDEFLSVQQMIENAGFFHLSSHEMHKNTGTDQFWYRIAVTTSRQKHEIVIAEKQVPENLRPLIRYLSQRVRLRKQRNPDSL